MVLSASQLWIFSKSDLHFSLLYRYVGTHLAFLISSASTCWLSLGIVSQTAKSQVSGQVCEFCFLRCQAVLSWRPRLFTVEVLILKGQPWRYVLPSLGILANRQEFGVPLGFWLSFCVVTHVMCCMWLASQGHQVWPLICSIRTLTKLSSYLGLSFVCELWKEGTMRLR